MLAAFSTGGREAFEPHSARADPWQHSRALVNAMRAANVLGACLHRAQCIPHLQLQLPPQLIGTQQRQLAGLAAAAVADGAAPEPTGASWRDHAKKLLLIPAAAAAAAFAGTTAAAQARSHMPRSRRYCQQGEFCLPALIGDTGKIYVSTRTAISRHKLCHLGRGLGLEEIYPRPTGPGSSTCSRDRRRAQHEMAFEKAQASQRAAHHWHLLGICKPQCRYNGSARAFPWKNAV